MYNDCTFCNDLKVSMSILLARHPIICCNAEIYGYELQYRGDNVNFCSPEESIDATQRLIERNGLKYGVFHVTEDKKAFINFTEEDLLLGLPKELPVKDVVIEILESVR
jgi:c-di-GMP-related signal transduction protein